MKRPLEEENLTELSFEPPKHHDSNKKLLLVTEDFPSHPMVPRVISPGEAKSKLCELDSNGMPETSEGALTVDKELEASIPFSLVSSSSREDHVGNQDSSLCYNAPGYIDLTIPRPPPEHFEDPYAYLLNCYPRKDIPIGPDHQVEVPEWDPSASEKRFSGSNNLIEDEREQKLMGTCISPSPDLNNLSIDAYAVGRGRTDCGCPDMGSVRCVQQHVREAREKLCYTIGEETFTKLGFFEMGEEVAARRWNADDELLFHKVVISNPASLGTDFWKHLTLVFPTRTKEELVSYYFNVFMLRRRGVQNRSYLLQIDSDDDEDLSFARVHYPSSQYLLEEDGNDLQHIHGGFHHVHIGGDEDSDVESFSDQDLDACWVDGYGSEPEYGCESKGCCDHPGTSNGILPNPKEGDVNDGSKRSPGGNVPEQDALEMDDGISQVSGQENAK